MGPLNATKTCFQKYARVSGRASLSEFYGFFIVCCVGAIPIIALDMALGVVSEPVGPITLVYVAVFFLPGIAVYVRRLHDIGRPGSHVLNPMGMTALFVQPSDDGPNQCGPNPLEPVQS